MKILKIKITILTAFIVACLAGSINGLAATPEPASKHEIRKGLVAYWPLDTLSTTTPDLSGNRNHLQAINLTAADVVPGKRGNAISFNGTNSLLLCYAANGSGLPASSHPACTVAMWVKGNTANETGRVFSETTNARSPLVAISTDRRAPEGVVDLYMRADNDITLVSHHRTSLVAFDNTWHHIACVDDRGNPRIYVDGVLDTNSCTYMHQPITPTITALGGVMREDEVLFAFQGLIDEAAIWSRALTETEIRSVMMNGLNTQLNTAYKSAFGDPDNSDVLVVTGGLGTGDSVGESTETVKDADGNIYHTVKIGNQVWTVENLRTTKFNDGTPIPHVADNQQWKTVTTPGYCYYENNPEHAEKYGILYNWYAASSRKIAPKGWRVPTREEQLTLRQYLIANGYNYDGTTEGNKVAKSMATKTGWIYKPTNEGGDAVSDIGTVGKNPETNNRTGFSAVPSGSRWCDASFHALGTSQYWWSATPYNEVNGYMSSVHTWFDKFGDNNHKKRSGFSIRLIRDDNNKGSNAAGMIPESFGDPDIIDVLVVTGGLGIDRDQFFALFNGRDEFKFVEYPLKDESEVFEDISDWKYDVLLLYNATQEISQKRRDNFISLLKDKGIGLVVVHHAQAAYQNWLEFHKINGSAFIYYDVKIDGNTWPHSKCKGGMDIPVTICDKEHPITRGLTDFRVLDETYKGRWWADDNHVLLTTDHPENDNPIAWTRQYGKSRVFNIQLGHDYHTYKVPQYRDLIIRGICWADGAEEEPGAGDSVGESTETVKDADGNIYHTVRIGNQVWTVEDLKTTRFNDGTPIPNITKAEGWKSLNTPGYCYYENDPENGKKYGVLYNWYAASSDKIAPKGWRVPTHDEQIALMDYLIANGYNYDGTTEENKIGKSMAAKTGWIYTPTNEGNESLPDVGMVGKNLETNNSSGFSALPAGSRWNDGSFHSIGQSVYWWSTTPVNGDDAHLSCIKIRYDKYGFNQHHKRSGFCIRLIRE